MLTPQDKQWFLERFHDAKTWQFDQFHGINVGIGLLIARVNDIETQTRNILALEQAILEKTNKILKNLTQSDSLRLTFDPPVQK